MPSSAVFDKWKAGTLHSGSKHGPPVKSHAQAIAIYLSEKRKEAAHGGKYPERAYGGPIETKGGVEGAKRFMSSLYNISPEAYEQRIKQQGQEASDLADAVMGRQMGGPIGMSMPPQGQQGLGTLPMLGKQPPGMPAPGMGRPYQLGGSPTSQGLTTGWMERQEARSMHTGPILSTVGGRTDQHNINVPSGSYVFPAAHVSALGQGNTINGLKVLSNMFGPSIHNPRGMGIPRATPPRPMNFGAAPGLPASMRADGGKTTGSGHHVGKPVPIAAAGGEYVLGPDQVMRVGGGDLERGHKILDAWVQRTHKKYAKTIANLPPPAKS